MHDLLPQTLIQRWNASTKDSKIHVISQLQGTAKDYAVCNVDLADAHVCTYTQSALRALAERYTVSVLTGLRVLSDIIRA